MVNPKQVPESISPEVARELYRIVHMTVRLVEELHDSPLSLQSQLNSGLPRMKEMLEFADAGI